MPSVRRWRVEEKTRNMFTPHGNAVAPTQSLLGAQAGSAADRAGCGQAARLSPEERWGGRAPSPPVRLVVCLRRMSCPRWLLGVRSPAGMLRPELGLVPWACATPGLPCQPTAGARRQAAQGGGASPPSGWGGAPPGPGQRRHAGSGPGVPHVEGHVSGTPSLGVLLALGRRSRERWASSVSWRRHGARGLGGTSASLAIPTSNHALERTGPTTGFVPGTGLCGVWPAAHRGRCYDFQCQELAANFFRFA
jgi:hypothetical protein